MNGYSAIIATINHEYNLARVGDLYWRESSYRWVIGLEAFCVLERMKISRLVYNFDRNTWTLYGIPVTIENNELWETRLYKRVSA